MPAFGKARNLCWALLLQGIFNDPHFQDLLQQHGGDLRKTWEFKDYLRKVASARVLPILKAILSHKDYAPAIKLGKFEFLRTKNVFDRGMDLAGKMFGWTKRSI